MNDLGEHDLADEVGARWLEAMRAGDWDAAWQQTDRLELPRRAAQHHSGFHPQPHHLRWDGAPFAGRSVLVRCLHGLGDTLQYLRFVPQIAAQARELHFLVQPMLLELLSGTPGLGQVSNAWTDHPPAHEVEIEVMELAYVLRASAASVAPPWPALVERVAARAARRPPVLALGDGTLRVGLLWAASEWDTSRSVPLDRLAPLLQVPGVRFFSLQQGPPANDSRVGALGIQPLGQHTAEIADAAAAMLGLDLVIAVDGMPAHLSGSLGRPTWVLLKHEADWRWMRERTDSPWYPSMRLFRQPRAGDWDAVVVQAAAALRAWAARPVVPTPGVGASLPRPAGAGPIIP